MAKLNLEEKTELLRLSRSKRLRKDLRGLQKKSLHVDLYLRFLTSTNAFANHKMKPFRKIKGDNFKL